MFSDSSFAMKSTITLLALIPALWISNLVAAEPAKAVDDFRDAATKANALLTIPDWAQTPEAVEKSVSDAIATANAALDEIGKQDLKKVTFKSTIVALDDLAYPALNAVNKASVIKESNKDEKM